MALKFAVRLPHRRDLLPTWGAALEMKCVNTKTTVNVIYKNIILLLFFQTKESRLINVLNSSSFWALLTACFRILSCFAYSSTLKMEAVCSSGWILLNYMTIYPSHRCDNLKWNNFVIVKTIKIYFWQKYFLIWRMPSSGMWRHVDLVWTDVSEERIASIFKVEKSASEEPPWAGGCRLSHQSKTPSYFLICLS
jgi:hypothetical protein